MKAEEISKAVGRLDEEMILPVQEEREKGKRKTEKRKGKRPFWISFAAVAACVGIIGGVVLANGYPWNSGKNSVYAAALAAPEYPVAAKYPDKQSCLRADGTYDSDKSREMYELWSKQRQERRLAAEALRVPNSFYKASINEFLTGAGSENRVYSPVNVYMALAMLAETTDGDSRAQILELLGAESIEELREQAKTMWMANYRDDGATASILANSFWLNNNVSYRQDTLDTLARDYFAASFSGDPAGEEMTALLRQWINEQTKGLLKDAVDHVKLSPETVLALCSTVYFRVRWEDTFAESDNDTKIFHGIDGDIQTEFMNNQSNSEPYFRGENYGAISLDFENGGSMWLILPDEGKTVDDLLGSGEYLDMIGNAPKWENKKYFIVHISVPKFDVFSETDLKGGLQALGVTDVFDSGRSDFTPLTVDRDEIYVSEARHAARVCIDEEGCVAAASTLMMIMDMGAEISLNGEMDFILDRPFLFVITSDAGQPLFTGVVNQP